MPAFQNLAQTGASLDRPTSELTNDPQRMREAQSVALFYGQDVTAVMNSAHYFVAARW